MVIDDEQNEVEALLPTEIVMKTSNFFDYYAKYTPNASDKITPARISDEETRAIRDTARRVHEIIGASGVSCVDFILAPDGSIYTLEIDTIPAMTPESVVPNSVLANGMKFPEFLDRLVTVAFRKYGLTNRRN